MVHINPVNIISMLITSLQISSSNVSLPNPREIDLHDAILDIITRYTKEGILVEDD
ncbi:hypothetical protein WH47_01690 [Habropoda laboriosa]|uniref:Uncharacterized protein n=1 Tax=Habropoda laboriosa TaxID=597456 RepID=A0A0L7QZY2_9HYME|nr:hypothetical protein WH47_01690 [Habropoda laboriosa]